MGKVYCKNCIHFFNHIIRRKRRRYCKHKSNIELVITAIGEKKKIIEYYYILNKNNNCKNYNK